MALDRAISGCKQQCAHSLFLVVAVLHCMSSPSEKKVINRLLKRQILSRKLVEARFGTGSGVDKMEGAGAVCIATRSMGRTGVAVTQVSICVMVGVSY